MQIYTRMRPPVPHSSGGVLSKRFEWPQRGNSSLNEEVYYQLYDQAGRICDQTCDGPTSLHEQIQKSNPGVNPNVKEMVSV